MKRIKAMSLFANVGIAETYLEEIGVDVVVANELLPQRANFYKHLYPKTQILIGDITDESIQKNLIKVGKRESIDLIIATPPCQGMSTVGKKDKEDPRNYLITYAVNIIKKLKPRFIIFENVPQELKTSIKYKGKNLLIPNYLKEELSNSYYFNKQNLINAADFGVPQSRERAIILLSRKDSKYHWEIPSKKEKRISLKEAIGYLPSLDPEIYDISYEEMLKIFPEYEEKKNQALKISKWFYPPKHIYRQVLSLMHTPTGKTAFDNIDQFKPKKANGSFVKGFKNTYKRQEWDKPGYTVTMYNRTIGSQNNVHPGRYLGKDQNGYDIYSDARVLTVYELMLISSLPKNWNIPDWASEHFVRQVIGEGVPPLLMKKILLELVKNL